MGSIKKVARSFATHNGHFHADEVTACALLLLYDCIDWDKIIRTRERRRYIECEYICDIGGLYAPDKGLFDHHQDSYRGELSSAGMILLHLFQDKGCIDQEEYDFFHNQLIWGVDAHDNGQPIPREGYAFFSQIVSSYYPVGSASDEVEERSFFEALLFTYHYLERLRSRLQAIRSCRGEIERTMSKGGELLFFERALPWLENFFFLKGERHPAKFLLMPSKNRWKVRAIPPCLEKRMAVRLSHPASWLGKQGEALEEVTQIEGAIFCHKGGFISIWRDRKAAVQGAQKILSLSACQ